MNIVEFVKRILRPPLHAASGGWRTIYSVREPYAGAWQQNYSVDYNTVLSFHAVFACMTLIASDIAKLRIKLVEQVDGIWKETSNPAYSPVLRKPNHFQTRIQFIENWMLSKLSNGNAYMLKQRDARNVVTRLYVLDPTMVTPMISDVGAEVFYEIRADNVVSINKTLLVPAREIIHDRYNCLFHPLVGISPLYAAALAALQGLNIQTDSTVLFGNRSLPGGLLIAPGRIADATAANLKEYWATNFSGENRGKIAVVGDGLKFQPLAQTAVDSQLIEQLKWTADVVCSAFHVPPYKIGVGQMPTYNNVQALNLEYYQQCLQSYIEAAELLLDEGLETGTALGTEFDTLNLLRMDEMTATSAAQNAIRAGFLAPNEARKRFDLEPVDGGDTPYLQQQNYSLAALAKRDAKEDPFAKTPSQQPQRQALPPPDEPPPERMMRGFEIAALLQEGAQQNAT